MKRKSQRQITQVTFNMKHKMTQRLDEINKKDRVRGPTRILPQMGSMPKKKINTVARTKLDVYSCPFLRIAENQE